MNSQEFLVDSDLKKGFFKGSIWSNLFSPYKFIVEDITNQSEEELLILMLEVYSFASTELTLYYLTHSDSSETLEYLSKINIEKNKLDEYISSKYYALSHSSNEPKSYFIGDNSVGI